MIAPDFKWLDVVFSKSTAVTLFIVGLLALWKVFDIVWWIFSNLVIKWG